MKQALAFALVAVFGFGIVGFQNSNAGSENLASMISLKSFSNFNLEGSN